MEFACGSVFRTKTQLKNAVKAKTRAGVYMDVKKTDARHYHVVCVKSGCPFVVSATKNKSRWQINACELSHSCDINKPQTAKRLTATRQLCARPRKRQKTDYPQTPDSDEHSDGNSEDESVASSALERLDKNELGAERTTRRRVILGLSGSVATIKAEELVTLLSSFAEVQVVGTKAALNFFQPASLIKCGASKVFLDEQEWHDWKKIGDTVLHIALRNWADCLVIAPLSANTLAKLATGLCDNLLTCVARAWDERKPLLVAPAMNTMMWKHSITNEQLKTLNKRGCTVIDPVAKQLACGDVGVGAMASVQTISDRVKKSLEKNEKEAK